jgi:YVTN family beta-propeller protein
MKLKNPISSFPAIAAIFCLCILAPSLHAEDPFAVFHDKSVLFNGWGLSPAGQHIKIGSMSLKIVISPDGTHALASSAGGSPGLAVVDLTNNKQTQWIPLDRAFNGLCFSKDGQHVFVSGGSSNKISCFSYKDGAVTLDKTVAITPDDADAAGGGGAGGRRWRRGSDDFLAGMAIQPDSGDLYLCAQAKDEIWVVSTATLLAAPGKDPYIKATIRVGERPYACIFGADKKTLYVSNWGARSVSAVDTETQKVIRTLDVGIRPNDMALSPDGRLFVACAGDNTVWTLTTRRLMAGPRETNASAPPDYSAAEVIDTALYPQSPEGSTPVGVTVSTDGKALFAINADNNDVMIADISDPKITRVVGFIPTGWYPTAVAFHNNHLLVANGKGLQSRPNYPAQLTEPRPREVGGTSFDYAQDIFEGSLSVIDCPDPDKTAQYTAQVQKNCPFKPAMMHTASADPKDSVIPSKVGAECPIKYVLYIIKENRTYDQVLGDFKDAQGKPAGNGDPKLAIFGDDITPNQHQLARDYVLLDNFCCNGEVSVDGHSWCDGAIANDANEKGWIVSYSRHGRVPLTKDMDAPAAGFLWDQCKRHGVSFKCYGEGSNTVASDSRANWPNRGRDTDKAKIWIDDLEAAEKTGKLPSFMIMSLGEDHTQGTSPGRPTPGAAVASNDLAVGQIVQAASKSKFWSQMAIFIVEDDAQNGPDHIDSHRTTAFVVSPYVKRGIVDSIPYTQVSMVRTIELILGLPPMTQYDAAAVPMFNSFQSKCEPVAFTAQKARTDLSAINSDDAPGAHASANMDFDDYDEAPEDELNRVLWLAMKGPNQPYPVPVRRADFR